MGILATPPKATTLQEIAGLTKGLLTIALLAPYSWGGRS